MIGYGDPATWQTYLEWADREGALDDAYPLFQAPRLEDLR